MKNLLLKNKLVLFLLFFILIGSLVSCKKLDQLLTFTIANESSITIKSSSPVNLPFTIESPNVTTNSSQQFQNNNSSINLIKDIRLKNLQLIITNPSDQSFGFLQSIHIFISTTSSNEIEFASSDNIVATATTISLTSTQAKLDDFIKASSYKLRTEVVTRQFLTKDVEIKIASKFNVTANL